MNQKCYECDIEMTPVSGKFRTWCCPLCEGTYRIVTNLQWHMERIAQSMSSMILMYGLHTMK